MYNIGPDYYGHTCRKKCISTTTVVCSSYIRNLGTHVKQAHSAVVAARHTTNPQTASCSFSFTHRGSQQGRSTGSLYIPRSITTMIGNLKSVRMSTSIPERLATPDRVVAAYGY